MLFLDPPWICRSIFQKLWWAFPDFLWRLLALADFMRLSLLKAAHVVVGECRVAGNPGRPPFSAHVRSTASRDRWGERGAPVLSFAVCYDTDSFGTEFVSGVLTHFSPELPNSGVFK